MDEPRSLVIPLAHESTYTITITKERGKPHVVEVRDGDVVLGVLGLHGPYQPPVLHLVADPYPEPAASKVRLAVLSDD